MTVSELVRDYLEFVSVNNKPKTLRIRKHFLIPFAEGLTDVATVNPFHLTRYLLRQTWGSTTKRMCILSVAACFSWAVEQDLIKVNPFAHFKKPRSKSRAKDCVPTDEEHMMILAAADPDTMLFLLALNDTGARPDEVRRVTAREFRDGNWQLDDSKTGAKTIYLTPRLQQVSRTLARQRPSGPLFLLDGKPWSEVKAAKKVAALRKRLGINRPITPYSWRHRFATDYLLAGGSIAYLKELLGHKSSRMIEQHYAHLTGNSDALRRELLKFRGRDDR